MPAGSGREHRQLSERPLEGDTRLVNPRGAQYSWRDVIRAECRAWLALERAPAPPSPAQHRRRDRGSPGGVAGARNACGRGPRLRRSPAASAGTAADPTVSGGVQPVPGARRALRGRGPVAVISWRVTGPRATTRSSRGRRARTDAEPAGNRRHRPNADSCRAQGPRNSARARFRRPCACSPEGENRSGDPGRTVPSVPPTPNLGNRGARGEFLARGTSGWPALG